MPLFGYDCNSQTKNKLEDENKTNIFYICLASLSDKQKREQKAYFIVGCVIQSTLMFHLILLHLS